MTEFEESRGTSAPTELESPKLNVHPGTLWILDRFTRPERTVIVPIMACDAPKREMSYAEFWEKTMERLQTNLLVYGRPRVLPLVLLDPLKNETKPPQGAQPEGTEQ